MTTAKNLRVLARGLRFVQIEFAQIRRPVDYASSGLEFRDVLYGLDQEGVVWFADLDDLKADRPGPWRRVRDDYWEQPKTIDPAVPPPA